jgi:hypothetical protein
MCRRYCKAFLAPGRALPYSYLVDHTGKEAPFNPPTCASLGIEKILADESTCSKLCVLVTHSRYQAERLSSAAYR